MENTELNEKKVQDELSEAELRTVAGGAQGELTEIHDMLNSMVDRANAALDAAERENEERWQLHKQKIEEESAKGMAGIASHQSPDFTIKLPLR